MKTLLLSLSVLGGGLLLARPAQGQGVGIGTTAPTRTLDVNGSLRVRGLSTSGVLTTDASGNVGSAPASALGDNLGNHTATQNLDLSTYQLVGNGGSSGLSVSGTGQVGIGTTAPAAPLDVQAGTALTGTSTGTETQLRLTRPGTSFAKWNSAAELAVGTYATGINSQSQLDFRLGNSFRDQADQTVLTLRGDGRVGVGTALPSATLDVNGATRLRGLTTAGLVTTDADGNLGSGPAATLLAVDFIRNTANQQPGSRFNISGNGLVGGSLGIGTQNPAQELHVLGGPALTGANTGTSPLLRLTRPGTSGAKWDANAELALGTYATGVNAQARLDFNLGNGFDATPDQTVLTLRGDGRVGVGTTGPVAQLEVALPSAIAAPSLKLEQRGSNLIVRPAVAGGGSTVVENTAGNLLLNPSGNRVGIGTAAPRAALEVAGWVFMTSYSYGVNGLGGLREHSHTWNHNLGYRPVLMLSIQGIGANNYANYITSSFENVDDNTTIIRTFSNANGFASAYFRVRFTVIGQE